MKTRDQLDDNARTWLDKSLQWADGQWVEDLGLAKAHAHRRDDPPARERHTVRDTVWYAAGLLARGKDGDRDRAAHAIRTILANQYDAPQTVYHGTFRRYPDEPTPPPDAAAWRDYDPNWREFICTTFVFMLAEFGGLLPDDLQEAMRRSIHLAAEGAYHRQVAARYTNISLMSALLIDIAGEACGNPTWRSYALDLALEIERLWARGKTFNEYNSPTYYGVDLYALALWRRHGLTPDFRELGGTMFDGLWRDVAQFYHAGMRNICGPYDRAYGMDMTRYLAAVGLWIAAALPPALAPLPDVDRPFDHAGDYYLMPVVALLGPEPPADVMPHLVAFRGERTVERMIEPGREATAWLSERLMLGAQADHLNAARSSQYHPATAHWVASDGSIGWMRTRCLTVIQARAKPDELMLSGPGSVEYVLEICVQGADAGMIQHVKWVLPGLTVDLDAHDTQVSTDQKGNVLTVHLAGSGPVTMTFSV